MDTVYAHVFASQRALNERGLDIDGWRIHRRIGTSTSTCAERLGVPADECYVIGDAEELRVSLDELGVG